MAPTSTAVAAAAAPTTEADERRAAALDFFRACGFASCRCCRCGRTVDALRAGATMLQCGRCRVAHYCSAKCHAADFAEHHPQCVRAVEQARLLSPEDLVDGGILGGPPPPPAPPSRARSFAGDGAPPAVAASAGSRKQRSAPRRAQSMDSSDAALPAAAAGLAPQKQRPGGRKPTAETAAAPACRKAEAAPAQSKSATSRDDRTKAKQKRIAPSKAKSLDSSDLLADKNSKPSLGPACRKAETAPAQSKSATSRDDRTKAKQKRIAPSKAKSLDSSDLLANNKNGKPSRAPACRKAETTPARSKSASSRDDRTKAKQKRIAPSKAKSLDSGDLLADKRSGSTPIKKQLGSGPRRKMPPSEEESSSSSSDDSSDSSDSSSSSSSSSSSDSSDSSDSNPVLANDASKEKPNGGEVEATPEELRARQLLAGVALGQCFYCGKKVPPPIMFRCGRCNVAFYCKIKCLQKDFEGTHRSICRFIEEYCVTMDIDKEYKLR